MKADTNRVHPVTEDSMEERLLSLRKRLAVVDDLIRSLEEYKCAASGKSKVVPVPPGSSRLLHLAG